MRALCAMFAIVTVFGSATAAQAGDMWDTLRAASKTPEQIQAEARAKQEEAAQSKSQWKKVRSMPAPADPSSLASPDNPSGDLPVMGECFQQVQAFQADVIATILERKLLVDRSLTEDERRAIRGDIAAMRGPQEYLGGEVTVRAIHWLTTEEHEQVSTKMIDFTRQAPDECRASGAVPAIPPELPGR